jgi:hypothetical protein
LLVTAGAASGSIFVTPAPLIRPALRVDAAGNAEVSWTQQGARRTVIVPAKGQLSHGGSLPGQDVSRPAALRGLAFARIVRRTPDGRLWALQQWPNEPGGRAQLQLSRWKGAPTKLTLALLGDLLMGRATFHGRPAAGRSYTLEGKRPRIYVYLDYLAGGTWHRMLGAAPRRDGSFAVRLRPAWKGTRYRATLVGPNIGATFAPDARAILAAP